MLTFFSLELPGSLDVPGDDSALLPFFSFFPGFASEAAVTTPAGSSEQITDRLNISCKGVNTFVAVGVMIACFCSAPVGTAAPPQAASICSAAAKATASCLTWDASGAVLDAPCQDTGRKGSVRSFSTAKGPRRLRGVAPTSAPRAVSRPPLASVDFTRAAVAAKAK
ncbi:MAG: hypothetical protein FRX49_07981 [Trebouxia sp. A1-2]|nr:MAG: hypothetical protein FRX49_07981 [Trebouxia sp. A1-2]